MRTFAGIVSAFWGLALSVVLAVEMGSRTPLTEGATLFKWGAVLVLILGGTLMVIVGMTFAELEEKA